MKRRTFTAMLAGVIAAPFSAIKGMVGGGDRWVVTGVWDKVEPASHWETGFSSIRGFCHPSDIEKTFMEARNRRLFTGRSNRYFFKISDDPNWTSRCYFDPVNFSDLEPGGTEYMVVDWSYPRVLFVDVFTVIHETGNGVMVKRLVVGTAIPQYELRERRPVRVVIESKVSEK